MLYTEIGDNYTLNKKLMPFCGKNMRWHHLLHHHMSLPNLPGKAQGTHKTSPLLNLLVLVGWRKWCKIDVLHIEWQESRFNILELQYCTFESDTSNMHSILFSKYSYWIRISNSWSCGPTRLSCGYARFAKISHFHVPAEESRGPASDTQPNLALRVVFVSC